MAEQAGPWHGFSLGFLYEPSGFYISESLIHFDAEQPILRALTVGMLNTLKVSLGSILCATLLGLVVGLCRLSSITLVRGLSATYIETLRNLPLLLQILAWYFVFSSFLPDQAWSLGNGFYLSKAGFHMPGWVFDENIGHWSWQPPDPTGFSITGGWSLSPEFLTLCIALSTYTSAYLAEIVRAGVQAVPRGQSQAGSALG